MRCGFEHPLVMGELQQVALMFAGRDARIWAAPPPRPGGAAANRPQAGRQDRHRGSGDA